MRLRRMPDGSLELSGIPAEAVEALRAIPTLLASEDPSVAEWRSPRTYDDDEDQADWQSTAEPELAHLFESRQRTIAGDLAGLVGRTRSRRLTIPEAHRRAWLSGLNAARHILFLTHGLTSAELETDPTAIADARRAAAALQVHYYGWLQELLIHVDASDDPA